MIGVAARLFLRFVLTVVAVGLGWILYQPLLDMMNQPVTALVLGGYLGCITVWFLVGMAVYLIWRPEAVYIRRYLISYDRK